MKSSTYASVVDILYSFNSFNLQNLCKMKADFMRERYDFWPLDNSK